MVVEAAHFDSLTAYLKNFSVFSVPSVASFVMVF